MRLQMLFVALCAAMAQGRTGPQDLPIMAGGMSLDKKVYIYELPSKYNLDLLEENTDCDLNASKSVYTAETAIWKGLLESHAVVDDPNQAALFFVPWLPSCYLRTKNRAKDANFWDSWLAAYNATLEVQRYIANTWPFWNLSEGKDHVWVFTDDLGGCNAPYEEVAKNSMLLVHEAERSHPSVIDHDDPKPEGEDGDPMPALARERYQRPCYDPAKDMVIPPRTVLNVPQETVESAASGKLPKSTLAFFQGLVEDRNKQYSHGVRQKLYQLYGHNGVTNLTNTSDTILVQAPARHHKMGDGRHTDGYLDHMANSTFCICPRGWAGWSPRISEAVLLGCIPVLIADNVRWPFENLIDYHEFSMMVSESQLDGLQAMLHFLQPNEIQSMQKKLSQVRGHFSYDLKVPNNAIATILQLL